MTLPVGSASPWLVPLVLAGCGGVALAMAVLRAKRERASRLDTARRGIAKRVATRTLVTLYAVVGVSAVAFSGIECASRVQLFWNVDWNADEETLTLDRPAPIGDVSIARDELTAVTEMAARERSFTGPRVVVRFVVHTTSGNEYWSAPVHDGESAARLRQLMQTAMSDRLETFRIGGAELR